MEFIEKITYIFVGLVIGLIIGLFVFRPGLPVGVAEYNRFSETTKSKVEVATSSAVTILSAKGGRQYALIVNDGPNVVYLDLGPSAELEKGVRLNANGGSYEITSVNLYVGKITGIAQTDISTVSVVEK